VNRITVMDVLTVDQCEAITATVFDNKQYLVDRRGVYTLGAAAYEDEVSVYPAMANAFNHIISANFSELLTLVSDKLGEHFGAPCGHFSANVGYPSFHVFDSSSNGQLASIHIDEPYNRVNFSHLEWSDPFSFTLPVCMPSAGGGLDIWPHYHGSDDLELLLAEPLEPEYYPYELGKLYIHDGLTPHRVCSVAPMESGEFRVTLQGHGIHTASGIAIYF
jgi:hypothetical protein